MIWLQFAICSVVIIFCGVNLSKYGDVIAEKTGLGGAWVGLILLASITSMPELITGVSAVVAVGSLDLAYGGIMGSCVFNLIILALLDPMHGARPIFQVAGRGHMLSASFSILLIALGSVAILVHMVTPSLGSVSLVSVLIVLIYLFGIRTLYYYEKKMVKDYVSDSVEKHEYKDISIKKAAVMYSINGIVIIIAATFLPYIADEIATITGLGTTFVGNVFIAFATSLPEVVISITAIRIGALDMAIANMFGSNMFNILILAIDDLVYVKGPIYAEVSLSHAISGMAAILMTVIAVIALIYRPKKGLFLRFSWETLAMLVVGVATFVALFMLR